MNVKRSARTPTASAPAAASLPVAAAAYVSSESLPWFPLTEGVHIKLCRASLSTGQCVMFLRAQPGADLGTYCQHGVATIYTVAGCWRYREADWLAGVGDVVVEPAGSTHSFEVVGDVAAHTFVHLTGAVEFLDASGATLRVENAETLHGRYLAHCALHGIEPLDIASR
jgi:2,4'-dihydroxyacetophenone dioxygenase